MRTHPDSRVPSGPHTGQIPGHPPVLSCHLPLTPDITASSPLSVPCLLGRGSRLAQVTPLLSYAGRCRLWCRHLRPEKGLGRRDPRCSASCPQSCGGGGPLASSRCSEGVLSAWRLQDKLVTARLRAGLTQCQVGDTCQTVRRKKPPFLCGLSEPSGARLGLSWEVARDLP